MTKTAELLNGQSSDPSQSLDKSFDLLASIIEDYLTSEGEDLQILRKRPVFKNKEMTLLLWDKYEEITELYQSTTLIDFDVRR